MSVINVNVTKTEKEVTINATPNVTQILVNTNSGGGIPEAPIDGNLYGRKDATWEQVTASGGIPDAPNNANSYVRSALSWVVGYTKTAIDNLLNGKFDNPIGNNTQYLDGSGTPTTFPTIPSVNGLVPYIGATQDVDLDTNGLNTKFVKIEGTAGAGHLNLKHQSSNATAGGQQTALFAGSDGELYYKNDGLTLQQIASRFYTDSKVEDAIVNGVTTIAPSQNAVFDALALKANLTQVGNLLREEFTFSGSQTFTLANNYGQVYSVEVQGQGALSNSQYALVSPNQITINDTLDSDDYIVVIYSNAIAGIQPYYSQAEVDALLSLKSNSNQTPRTWKSGIDGVTVANTTTITPTYTQLIPANTFTSGDVVELLFRSTSPGAKTSASNNYIYVNTTNNLSGTPIQIGILTGGATTRTIQLERALAIKGATTRVINSAGTTATDTGISAAMTTLTINWAIDQYIIFAIGHTVNDQTMFGDFFRIIKN